MPKPLLRPALAPRFAVVLDAVLVFLLTGVLIAPLFRLDFSDQWHSIESTFIGDGRFLREHWPPPRWQPNWYCGTRFDYIYPPGLRYGTALLSRALDVSTARSYHLYTAVFYCVGIMGVYLLVRLGSGSRGAAWLGASAAALLSPSFLFMTHIRRDAAFRWLEPQRLNALYTYGEGPHMTAFAILPIALICSWWALRGGRPGLLGLAALFSGLVVANNFYGATALAILFAPLVWAVWLTHQDHRIWLRAAVIALLAYGLTAYWLVPSYVQITLRNMRLVSQPGNAWSVALAVAAALVYALATWRLAHGRREAAWPVFVAGAALFMGLNVLGQYYFGFRVSGEPERLVPELDLVLILLALELLRRLWSWRPAARPAWLPRTAACLLVLLSFWPARRYVRHAWELFRPDPNWRQRIEYRLTNWIAENLPGERLLVSGSVRFWYNAWHDLPQVGGGSEQGVLNLMVEYAQAQVLMNETPELSLLWLQAMGAGAVAAHDKESQEIYKDWAAPRKFDGILPAIHDSGQGDRIYRVPRRFPGLARVVDRQKLRALRAPVSADDAEALRGYVHLVENGPDVPARFRRVGPERIRVQARLAPGQIVLVQESYDPSWRATSGGKPLAVHPDPMGFLWIDAPPGEHDIRLVFDLPLENFVGRILTLISLAVLTGLATVGWRTPRRRT